MCGRYRLSRRKEVLAEHFETNVDDLEWEPRYNVAPTQSIPVIRCDEQGSTLRPSPGAMGLDPILGNRSHHRRTHDQRAFRNCRH